MYLNLPSSFSDDVEQEKPKIVQPSQYSGSVEIFSITEDAFYLRNKKRSEIKNCQQVVSPEKSKVVYDEQEDFPPLISITSSVAIKKTN